MSGVPVWTLEDPRPPVRWRRASVLAALSAVVVGCAVVGADTSTGPEPGEGTTASPSGSPGAGPAGTDATDPLDASDPARLTVPAIGVDVEVMDLGLQPDGTLEVPPGAFPAGWYDGSPTPGELGPAVLAGHVGYNGTPGVFADLEDVVVGDAVRVRRDDGSVARFTITSTEEYAKDAFPTDEVYGDVDHAGLRLITCAGLDRASGAYGTNVVVYAELTDSRPAR